MEKGIILMILIHLITRDVYTVSKYNAGRQNKYSIKISGDYMIQSLMSITEGQSCEQVQTGGILRYNAVKFAIESRAKLKDLTIGYQIDDTCLNVPITMTRGIELTNQQMQSACLKDHPQKCTTMSDRQERFLAVIGAYFSFTSIPLASLLGVFKMPMLSFGASSPLLSKRSDYPSFFRTIPSDEFAVEALIDIIRHFNWTYIFAIGSEDDYGKRGLALLRKHANLVGICITGESYIPLNTNSTITVAKKIVKNLLKEKLATGVVMFSYALGMGEYILKEAEEMNVKRVWLTSEAWNPEVFSSKLISKAQLQSIITVSLDLGKPQPSFKSYIKSVVEKDYKRDIWLNKYIEQTFNCSVTEKRNQTLFGNETKSKNSSCTVPIRDINDSLLVDNPAQINNLIDAVDSVIYTMDNIVSNQCSSHPCGALTPVKITEGLQKLSFTTRDRKKFSYNAEGNPSIVSYSIEQIQMTTSGVKYVKIGNWSNNKSVKLYLNDDNIQQLSWSEERIPKSTCSMICNPGEKRVGVRACCWECRKCDKNTITNATNEDFCTPCPDGYHTKDKIECVKTPIVHLNPQHPIGIATIVLSTTGVFMVILCGVLVYMYRNKNRIKLWSKIFVTGSLALGFLSFFYTTLHMLTPTSFSCHFQTITYHVILTFYGGMLLLRNNSLSRFVSKIFNKNKNVVRTQVLIFCCIITTEVVLIIIWQTSSNIMPEKVLDEYIFLEQCIMEFDVLHILCVGFPVVIMFVATVQVLSERQAKKTIEKEEKYLTYTCIAFCIISVAYILALNQVVGLYRSMVTLCTMITYGYVYIGCMIITKIFRTITLPDIRNDGKLNERACVDNSAFQDDKRNQQKIVLSKCQPEEETKELN